MRCRILLVLMGVFSVVALENLAALGKTAEEITDKRIVRAAQSSSASSEPLFFVDALASSRGQPRIYEYPSRRNLLYPNTNMSFFSVNIDGWVYHNKADLTDFVLVDPFRWETYTHGWCRFRSYEGVYVREDITIIREKVHVRLTFSNADYYSHYVEARYLLDTMIDTNDGAYLFQQDMGLQGNERLVYYPSNPQVKAYDQSGTPSMVGIFENKSGLIWKMIFAAWPSAYSTGWSYPIDSSRPINNDSALLVYYDLGYLAPGEQRTIEFTYGIPGDVLISSPSPGPSSSWYPIIGQLHSHFMADDFLGSNLSPQILQELYRLRGYDFVAISEHYPEFKAEIEADWATPSIPPGMIDLSDSMEDTHSASHILGFGFESQSGSFDRNRAGTDDRNGRVKQIQNAGGFAAIAHPNPTLYSWTDEEISQTTANALEAYNASVYWLFTGTLGPVTGRLGGFATSNWDRLLRQGKQIWGTAGDDYTPNRVAWFDDGFVTVMTEFSSPTPAEIKTAMKNGRFYFSKGGYRQGQGAPKILGYWADVEASKICLMLDKPYKYVRFIAGRWWRSRTAFASQRADGRYEANFDFQVTDRYVRAEVHDFWGKISFTQPIFLSRLDSKTGSWGVQAADAIQTAGNLTLSLADAEIVLADGQSFSEATAELVPITLRPPTSSLPGGIIGECYRFTPEVLLSGTNTLSISFQPEELVVSSSRLRIFQYTSIGWQALTTVLEGDKAKANITSLGTFALSAVAATDNEPPQISFSAPVNGSTVSGPAVVTCNATDNQGVVEVVLSLDDTFLDNDHWKADGWQFLVDFTPYPSGLHKLRALARDLAGNNRIGEIDITITGGTPAPTISLAAPTVSDLFQHLIIRGGSADNEGLVEGIITIGGQPVAKISFNTDGTWQVDEWLTLLPILSGTQELKVIGYDAFGNQATVTIPIRVFVFTDITPDFWAYRAIYSIAQTGITRGCTSDPLQYCPNVSVTRAQMAVFLVRALGLETSIFDPADPTTWAKDFTDVPPDYWAWKEIQALYLSGITLGTTTTTFSPEMVVSRSQMAVFLSRALGITPLTPQEVADSTPTFEDVPKTYWAYNCIEPFKEQGITRGCRIEDDKLYFCPDTEVDRAQMAVFLARAFELAN